VGFVVGVDIGGTFTDSCAVELNSGRTFTAKARTTPDDLTEGVIDSLQILADDASLSLGELLARTVKLAHGTTQTSNVMFTWEGARTGLITTKGFRDELLIMRARGRVAGLSLAERRHLRATDKPPKIVPEELTREVSERIDRHGRVLVPLSREQVEQAVNDLVSLGVEAIAVSLLWSPRNVAHELLVEDVIKSLAPDVYISVSHKLAPILGEYERASTAVVNAFVGPTMVRYLDRLAERLRSSGLESPLLILQASGGVVRAEQMVPVHTVESGPAAGLVAAAAGAQAAGYASAIATDVGGTTFKVGMVVDGKPAIAGETIVNQYTLLIPMVDVSSIGAGGGSIAWEDEGRVRVGPQSAGASPGPACYGWGGTDPTVTDADVVLGFLSTDRFLGGKLKLRQDLAVEALRPLAEKLFNGDVVAAAAGIRTVIDAQMGDLVRKVTVERGYDPRAFALFAYGGAGPLHAASYGPSAGVDQIIVPNTATVFSAYGGAISDLFTSVVRSVTPELLHSVDQLDDSYTNLEAECKSILENQAVQFESIHFARWADMRYARQLHHVRVGVSREERRNDLDAALVQGFKKRYKSLYGAAAILPDAPVELLRIGVDVTGLVVKPQQPSSGSAASGTESGKYDERSVYWPDAGWLATSVYSGDQLRSGSVVKGPALIEQPGTTIAVPAGARASADNFGNIIVDLRG
jgi:N-methylhydantoinase A